MTSTSSTIGRRSSGQRSPRGTDETVVPEDEDSLGEFGDGTASLSAQNRALQSDLADKNRYIQTLEKRLFRCLVSRAGQGDKILLSADRNSNVRGALVTGLISALPAQRLTGLISALPAAQLTSLASAIDAGQVKTVLSLGEDLTAAGLSAAQLAKVSVIYLGTHKNATSDAAKVVIPTLTVFEKSGTFVNQQFRLQKFAKAVPGPAGVNDDLVTLAELVAAAGGGMVSFDLGTLWAAIATAVPALASVSYASLSSAGLQLDATPWAALPFVEGETLHFKPAAVPAAVNA